MHPISRRNILRVAGGAVGATVVTGELLESSSAGPGRKIQARLSRGTYRPGEVMRLHVSALVHADLRIRVVDSSGAHWKRVAKAGHRQVWTAKARRNGAGVVSVHVLWPDGRRVRNRRYRDRVHYRIVGPVPLGAALIGMSAPSNEWAQRVGEVGPGLAARRIYADLAAGAGSQIGLVEEAHRAGMLPVISYKVGGDVAGAISGKYNAVADQAAAKLASYGLPTAVTFWHEPNPDMTGAEYVAASKQLLPVFRRGELRVGPILNGWLLDN
jgi:hypothetical protein